MSLTNVHSHFGVYALILGKSGILLIKKARGPYTGMFDLPGGSPEILELLQDTLNREVKEETSCEVTKSSQLGAVSTLFKYSKDLKNDSCLRHLGVIYKCQIKGKPSLESDGEDSHGCVWVPLDKIKKTKVTPFVLQALKMAGPLTK